MFTCFINSIARELRFLRRDKWNLSLVTWVPLFVIVWFGIVFSGGSARRMPVIVADADQSFVSRQIVRFLEAAPGAEIVRVSDRFDDIPVAIRTREAYAAVFIPQGTELDVMRGAQARVFSYYNTLYYSSAKLIERDLEAAISAMNAKLSESRSGGATNRAVDGSPAFGAPLSAQATFLHNAPNSYEWSLGSTLIPAMLIVIMGNALVFSLLKDMEPKNRAAWVADAGGSMVLGIVAKVLFYACVFTAMGVIGILWMRWRGWPVNGSMAVLVAALILLFLAMGAVCVLLASASWRKPLFALSAINLYTGGGVSFGDILFPVNASPWFTRLIGEIMPFTSYMQAQAQQMQMGAPPGDSLWFLCKLGLFALIVFLAALLVLRVSLAFGNAAPQGRVTTGFFGADGREGKGFADGARILLRAIKGESAVAVLLFAATFVYTFYYPAAYVAQVSAHLPVAVVDMDNSAESRSLIRKVAAARSVEVTARPASFADARRMVERREVDGILLIGENFGRDALSGRTGRLAIYGNNAFIVRCGVVLATLGEAVEAAAMEIVEPQLFKAGIAAESVAARAMPVSVVARPLFNTREGYGSFAVPAVVQLVVHQTLLFGIFMLLGLRRQKAAEAGIPLPAMSGRAFFGLFVTLAGVGLIGAAWVNGYCLWLQDYPRQTNVGGLLVYMVVYVCAVVALAMLAGAFVDRVERALQFFTVISMPLFFALGVSWPLEMIPVSVRAVVAIFPAAPGSVAFAKLGQMGASLAEARGEILHLMIIAVVCVALAWLRLGRGTRRVE